MFPRMIPDVVLWPPGVYTHMCSSHAHPYKIKINYFAYSVAVKSDIERGNFFKGPLASVWQRWASNPAACRQRPLLAVSAAADIYAIFGVF